METLPKPSVTAWLANQLAREHREELQPLLELGAALREATRTLSGDQLRDLSCQQHELVYALVQQGRQVRDEDEGGNAQRAEAGEEHGGGGDIFGVFGKGVVVTGDEIDGGLEGGIHHF